MLFYCIWQSTSCLATLLPLPLNNSTSTPALFIHSVTRPYSISVNRTIHHSELCSYPAGIKVITPSWSQSKLPNWGEWWRPLAVHCSSGRILRHGCCTTRIWCCDFGHSKRRASGSELCCFQGSHRHHEGATECWHKGTCVLCQVVFPTFSFFLHSNAFEIFFFLIFKKG